MKCTHNTQWFVREVANGWIVEPAFSPGTERLPSETFVFEALQGLTLFFRDKKEGVRCG